MQEWFQVQGELFLLQMQMEVPGTFSLSGINTYIGPTAINGGTLSIAAINNGGFAGNIGATTNAASNLVLGGGTLLYTGTRETTDRNFTLTNGTTSTININTNTSTLTLSGAATGSTGSLTKAGTGTLVFSGSNQYTGATTINAGTLQIAASERINDASALSIAGGTFDLNGFNETVGSLSGPAGIITSNATGAATLTVGGDNSSTSFSGNILNGSGAVALIKQGTGTLTLSGNNTYTGTTTINAGKIQSNSSGALSATNSVNVSNAGTLQISQNQTLANVTLAAGSTLTVDATKTLTIAGTLTINTGANVNGAGAIAYATGVLVYSGSGNLTTGIEWPTSNPPNSVNINTGATVTLSGAKATTNTPITIDGTLDVATYSNTGSGTVNINGTLITQNSFGLKATSATFTGSTLLIGSSSTIIYNANGNQNVQGATDNLIYYNMVFSGSGTKTLSSTPYNNGGAITNPSGTITVSGSAIFNAQNWTFGGSGTNLTMSGTSVYKTAGTTTKPDATGTYSLGANTTIDFSNISGTEEIISSAHTYANILVSGSSVADTKDIFGPSTITIQAGGSFNVTGTFNVHNVNGFSGAANTAINNTNNPTINLQAGSTIQYNRSDGTAQQITNSLAYQNLNVAGSGTKTAPTGILTVQGNLTKLGTSTFVHNGGTVLLNGANQTFAGLTYNNLILSNNTKTTSGNSTIIDSIKINDGTTLSISNNPDTITLHSDAVKTARVGQIGSALINYNSGGKFTVERFIPAKVAWRFLAVPVNSPQTIKAAWQEGALISSSDPKPGYGIQITSDDNANWAADGFDNYSFAGSSMKTYNAAGDNYIGITSTLNSLDPSAGGYMTFIRGNRLATGVGSPVSSTVLRTTGQLFTGDQPPITLVPGQFIPINNPYASQVDLRSLSQSNSIFYYVWDPNMASTIGYGGFRTFSWNTLGYYDVTPPAGGSYGPTNNYISSGQAFFVAGTGGPVQFTENAKTSAPISIIPFTPAGVPSGRLRTDLYTVYSDGSQSLSDGILCVFGNDYSNTVNDMDARKNPNPAENLSVKNSNVLLAVERRRYPASDDTIFLDLAGTTQQHYKLQTILSGINAIGTDAFLEDNFLHTRNAIYSGDTAKVDFIINADPASAAPDRFRIVFQAAQGPLPVTITNVKAYTKNESIAVEWNVENETGIKNYTVEKSPDGTTGFVPSHVIAANNVALANNYTWLDGQPLAGYNYYRIKSMAIDGRVQYSKVVSVWEGDSKSGISVYPNPSRNGLIHLLFNNQPAGKYGFRLINKSGQVVCSKQMQHANAGRGTEDITIDEYVAHGVYMLEVIKPGGSIENINLTCY